MNSYKTNNPTPIAPFTMGSIGPIRTDVPEISLKVGRQVMEDLSRLANRAQCLAGLVEETFDPVVKPSLPISTNTKEVSQGLSLPSYFNEMHGLIESISVSLERIESVAGRSQI